MSSIQRRIALLIGAALALVALGGSTASAATVVKDAAGNPCPAVTPPVKGQLVPQQPYQSGGCTVQMTAKISASTKTYLSSATGGGVAYCFINYSMHVGPDGWGYATNYSYAEGSGSMCGGWKIQPAVVVPPEGHPGFAPVNADTDLWSYMVAYGHNSMTTVGFLPWEATQASPLVLKNQFATGSGYKSFSGGEWTGNTGLQITH